MESILKGAMYITDQPDIVYQAPIDGYTRIINLDEDDILDNNHPCIIGGTCLLPPLEAKIAECDGNEMLYDQIYMNHLTANYQYQFISALFAYLYRGGNIIFFLPEFGDNTKEKFLFHMENCYGVHIGWINNPDQRIASWYFDTNYIPRWLDMLYTIHVISPFDYLYQYPQNLPIQNHYVLNLLIEDIRPFGYTLQDQYRAIEDLRKKLHINPNTEEAIEMF